MAKFSKGIGDSLRQFIERYHHSMPSAKQWIAQLDDQAFRVGEASPEVNRS